MDYVVGEKNGTEIQVGGSQMELGRIRALFIVLGLFWSVALASPVWASDLVLVANHSVSVNTMSRSDVKKVFLSKKKNISGVSVKPIIIIDNKITDHFLRVYVRKTPSQFTTYYKVLIFSGSGMEPKAVSSEAEMISYVARTAGALGYVSSDAVTDMVKIINVEGE